MMGRCRGFSSDPTAWDMGKVCAAMVLPFMNPGHGILGI